MVSSCIQSCIQSNFLTYNKQILIINPFYLLYFSDKNVNYIKNLLDCLGSFKSRNVLKVELKFGIVYILLECNW